MEQKTIEFAGIEWNIIKGRSNPGSNNWSDSPDIVWVDSNGCLHLKVKKVGSTWYCADIYAKQSFGFGEYQFYVASNVERFARNIVAGFFTYENDHREIDIEFSKWGKSRNVSGWYTIQPPNKNNQKCFDLNLLGNYSTHKFTWNKNSIYFESYHGHHLTLPSSDFLINQWSYTGSDIPTAGNERLHINFYLYKGALLFNQKEEEIIINAVHVPLNL